MNSLRVLFALGTGVLLHQTSFATVITPATLQMSVDGVLWRNITLTLVGYDQAGFPVYGLNPAGSAYRENLSGLGFRDENGQPLTGPGWIFGEAGGDRIAFTNTTADTDPFISYAVSVTDSGAPSTFTFSFSTGIVLPLGDTFTRASLGVSVTDGSEVGGPHEGAAITNLIQDSFLNIAPGQDLFVDIGPAGPIVALPQDTQTQTLYPASGPGFHPGPAHTAGNPFTTLTVVTSFSLSGHDDNVALTGRVDIVPDLTNIPEPGTAGLALAGLGTLAFRRVRRRSV